MWQGGRVKNHLRRYAPVGRRLTPSEIALILQEHRDSGLSLLAFAHNHQLCYSTLLRWRRRQIKPASAPAGAPTAGPGFIPIEIEPGSLSADYVLSWPGGRSLRIPPRFDPPTLSRLLQVLEEQP